MLAPPKHRLVLTEDGSYTLHSEVFDEACHSTSGASEETRTHYLAGCDVAELLQTLPQVNILEVGFGTGLGWRETKKLAQRFPCTQLNFYSLELDADLAQWAIPQATSHVQGDRHWLSFQEDNATLVVMLGDARQSLPRWKTQLPRFHAVYQDAFSPRKNPTLWTKQWFALLGELAQDRARLATYSSSISIRKALHESGWGVKPGPAFARKKSSTRAQWNEASHDELLKELSLHPTLALSDEGLS